MKKKKKNWKGKNVAELKSEFREDIEVKKKVIDSTGSSGEDGDILTTTGTSIRWIDPAVAPATYTFTQASSSATWVIEHNLGKFPSATVINSANDVIIGDITYNTENKLTITFTTGPNTGKAYLN
ncbi:hypothetical protein N9378_00430 [Flavobacteriaceae bacterium]|nr:hypothetical protein [Flavobacteriaceae bacterium]